MCRFEYHQEADAVKVYEGGTYLSNKTAEEKPVEPGNFDAQHVNQEQKTWSQFPHSIRRSSAMEDRRGRD